MDDSLSYSELRGNLKEHLDRVCDNHIALLVKRRRGDDVVILSREDYEAMDETNYLLKSPANAKRLLTAVKRNPKKRKRFASIQALKDELGI